MSKCIPSYNIIIWEFPRHAQSTIAWNSNHKSRWNLAFWLLTRYSQFRFFPLHIPFSINTSLLRNKIEQDGSLLIDLLGGLNKVIQSPTVVQYTLFVRADKPASTLRYPQDETEPLCWIYPIFVDSDDYYPKGDNFSCRKNDKFQNWLVLSNR